MKTGRLFIAIAASALLVSPSFADGQAQGALAAGKPAGVHQADLSTPTLLALGVLTSIALGVALVVSNEGNSSSSPSTPAIVTSTAP